jgi:hypothetical protein
MTGRVSHADLEGVLRHTTRISADREHRGDQPEAPDREHRRCSTTDDPIRSRGPDQA